MVDGSGAIRYVNQAAERLFGRPRGELLFHPFGFPVVSGETTELELPGSGDSSRVVEMRVVESDWEDEPAYLASLRDITERKEAEAAARRLVRERDARAAAEESARRMRFLANSLTRLTSRLDYPDVLRELAAVCTRELADVAIVYGLDGDGSVKRLDVAHRDREAEALLRPLRLEAIGLDEGNPVRQVLTSGRSLVVSDLATERVRGCSPDADYTQLVTKLGVRSFAIVPMRARSRVVGALTLGSTSERQVFDESLVALAEDLAHRAALALDNAWLYAKSQEAIRAQTDLIAMVSHDLRTPLTSMLGYADLLRLGIPEPIGDRARAHAERIQASGKHVLYLIEQLTEFARLEAAGSDVCAREVDAHQLIREVTDLVEPLARARGLELRAEGPPGFVGHLITDPGKLRQVLLNLVGNAIKFTAEGVVTIRVRRVDGGMAFDVCDTGAGIDTEHLESIFQPFFQVPGPAAKSGGAGLGLSIVRRLVSRLGGRVTVRSMLGEGSTFTVIFPVRGAAPETVRGCKTYRPLGAARSALPPNLSTGSGPA